METNSASINVRNSFDVINNFNLILIRFIFVVLRG